MADFYASYGAAKGYQTPALNAKHIQRFDDEVWKPAGVRAEMRCLEIGCGTGHFLSYLASKGVQDFTGIDHDPNLADIVPENVRDRFRVSDAAAFVDSERDKPPYQRIFLFDVFEHFTAENGYNLLIKLKEILSDDGAIVLKMPNAGSPWGQQFQFGDITHLTGYTPDSIRQMAIAAGLQCTSVHPHLLGSPSRRFRDRIVQAVLDKLVATPPEIWEGNFYAILRRP